MSSKGFTLMELLAVIVILAVISLIATLLILGVIEKANKSAAIESTNGIMDAAEKYMIESMILGANTSRFDFPSDTRLSYKGNKPESGTLLIDEKGNMSITIKINGYCVRKRFLESNPKIIEENCSIEDSEIIKYDNYIALNKSNNDCVTDSTKICSKEEIIEGLEVSVNVNDIENYTFNVLKDNGDSLDLQSNFNIGSGTYWASKEDYKEFTGNDCIYENGCNDVGPITLLKNLKNLTDKWENIKNQSGIVSYTNNTIDMSNYKARLITFEEAQNLGCLGYKSDESNNNTCPLWFGSYYWTMSTHITSPSVARFIFRNATNDSYLTNHWITFRPVITVSKSSIK